MIIKCPACREEIDTMDQTEYDCQTGLCWRCSFNDNYQRWQETEQEKTEGR